MRKKTKALEIDLPPDVAEMLAATPLLEKVIAESNRSKINYDKDPEFVAGFNKSQFVEDIYRVMEKAGITKSHLARKLGKTRQYVNKILNEDEAVNFTIETMAAIGCALDCRMSIRLAGPGESVVFQSRRPQVAIVVSNPISSNSFSSNFNFIDIQPDRSEIRETQDVKYSAA